MEKAQQESKEISDMGRMNLWIADFLDSIQYVENESTGSQEAYLEGVKVGVCILRDRWLTGKFSK